jgi:hypothetical protein
MAKAENGSIWQRRENENGVRKWHQCENQREMAKMASSECNGVASIEIHVAAIGVCGGEAG